MKPAQDVYDDMRAADGSSWDGVSGPLKAFGQIATSVTEWLEENAPDVRASIIDIGDAVDGDDWLEVSLTRGDYRAAGEFKVGIAKDGLSEC